MPYFDHAATTKIDPDVLEIMNRVTKDFYGNPSSLHEPGIQARKHLNQAKNAVARLLKANRRELYFTGSATEANNLAIKGIYEIFPDKQILTSTIEHHATENTVNYLASKGAHVHFIEVNDEGFLNLEDLKSKLQAPTSLLSIVHTNNEIGTIQDIDQIITLAHAHGALVHLDMVQCPLHQAIDVRTLKADMISLSAHKFHGPRGVGCLYVRNGINFVSLIHGGKQEFYKRAGTENIAAIVGFSEAFKRLSNRHEQHNTHVLNVAHAFLEALDEQKIDYRLNGPILGEKRINSIVNIAIKHHQADHLSFELNRRGFYVSLGSACDSNNVEPSHVLKALKVPKEFIYGALRFSFNDENTVEEVRACAKTLHMIIENA